MNPLNPTFDNALPTRRAEVLDRLDIESVGAAFSRYALALVLLWIGLMKFTAYEAMGITPLVTHSPLMSWMLNLVSIRTVSTGLGIVEITTALLIASRRFSARAAQIGGLMAVITFLITLTFLFSTPGAWAAPLGGFPALSGGSGGPGQFLAKDVVSLGVAIWIVGEATNAIKLQSRGAV